MQNCISKIEGLEELTELTTLNLAGNCIEELSGLDALPHLTTLNVSKNALASVAAIEHLTSCAALTNVDLSDNSLPGDEANTWLATLARVPKLVTLYLKGNPLVRDTRHYRKATLAALPALQYLDDRPVFDVERVSVEAWTKGGQEAERAARTAFAEAEKAASKASSERFRAWQEEIRCVHMHHAHAHTSLALALTLLINPSPSLPLIVSNASYVSAPSCHSLSAALAALLSWPSTTPSCARRVCLR